MRTPPANRANSVSLSEKMYRVLENMIINGELEPGEHINENALAERHGVSRGPIREACRRLEEASFAEFKANRGFFVREITLEEVLEIYDIRAALFFHAGRILARRITDLQLEELKNLDDRMHEANAGGDSERFYKLNRFFHSRIMAFTGNKRLAAVYEGLDRELHLWRKRALTLDGNVKASEEEHGYILDVLRTGNPARIARCLRDHSLAGRNRLLRTMSNRIGGLTQTLWNDDDI